jgi:hypothetical protein
MVLSFLWSGNKQNQTYHLCRWEIISKPKVFGRWGLRNIFCFSRALVTNTLWRGLMQIGIWKWVIKDKYFPHISLTTWLQSRLSAPKLGKTS